MFGADLPPRVIKGPKSDGSDRVSSFICLDPPLLTAIKSVVVHFPQLLLMQLHKDLKLSQYSDGRDIGKVQALCFQTTPTQFWEQVIVSLYSRQITTRWCNHTFLGKKRSIPKFMAIILAVHSGARNILLSDFFPLRG